MVSPVSTIAKSFNAVSTIFASPLRLYGPFVCGYRSKSGFTAVESVIVPLQIGSAFDQIFTQIALVC